MPPPLTTTAPTLPQQRLYYGYAAVSLVAMVVALATDNYLLLGLPAVMWVLAQSFTDFRPLFYLMLVFIPLSTDIQLPGGLSTDIPTEPLAVGLTGLFVLHLARHWHEYASERFLHPIACLLYLHVGWILFTTFFSAGVTTSLKFSAAKLWYVGAYFLVPLLLIRSRKSLLIALNCIFWPLLFVAIQTLVRHAAYGFSFAEQHLTMYPFMPEHVSYAGCLSVFTPWLIFLRWWRGRQGKSTWWWTYLILPVWMIAVYFTFTRAAFVALVMAGGVYFLIKWKLLKPVLALAVVALLLGSAYVIQDNKYLDYAPDYNTTVSHDNFGNLISATYKLEDISTMERLYRWVAAGHMVPYEPWTGWGPGTFLQHYKGYTVEMFRTYVSDNEDGSGIHSYYLMTLVEQGFPGLVLFLVYILGALVYGARMYYRQRDPYARNAIMAALLALIIVDAFNIINDQMETDKIGAQYLLNLAFIIAMGNYQVERKDSNDLEKLAEPE
ncbi:O-antigen ligase [Lewinella sp. 4G2]|uniref:O-antigen ligase family protein n=1 Tax=Lewinella sp. 4G2 TaxID=1803372 RepID=UPI0007B4891F|nr:O-antigen ligase family protein [Lewinella sp. 4G2]OAV43023.1 hypothetical protein A3850_000240 [Lewinella sp. 4G2]